MYFGFVVWFQKNYKKSKIPCRNFFKYKFDHVDQSRSSILVAYFHIFKIFCGFKWFRQNFYRLHQIPRFQWIHNRFQVLTPNQYVELPLYYPSSIETVKKMYGFPLKLGMVPTARVSLCFLFLSRN